MNILFFVREWEHLTVKEKIFIILQHSNFLPETHLNLSVYNLKKNKCQISPHPTLLKPLWLLELRRPLCSNQRKLNHLWTAQYQCYQRSLTYWQQESEQLSEQVFSLCVILHESDTFHHCIFCLFDIFLSALAFFN